MSGTSMDGLDCCYADININNNNDLKFKIINYQTIPFNDEIKKNISKVIGSDDKELILNCHNKLGITFLSIVKKFIGENNIELISMHGQTISHTNQVKTLQIGNPEYLYEYYKVPVIYDFRAKDIKLGGNGAPLIPYLDWLLSKKINKNILTLNLGGIANIAYVPSDSNRDKVIGFDTGPGMCLIDQYVQKHWNVDFDLNGDIARKGKIDFKLVKKLLNHPYIAKDIPKSTSTEEFDMIFLNTIIGKNKFVDKYNVLRTLVYFTAYSIYSSSKLLPDLNNDFMLIINGGGVYNSLLIEDINKEFNLIENYTSNFFGIHGDTKEAFLMAVMGFARYNKQYNNMPSVTGAKKYASYGKIYE